MCGYLKVGCGFKESDEYLRMNESLLVITQCRVFWWGLLNIMDGYSVFGYGGLVLLFTDLIFYYFFSQLMGFGF